MGKEKEMHTIQGILARPFFLCNEIIKWRVGKMRVEEARCTYKGFILVITAASALVDCLCAKSLTQYCTAYPYTLPR